MIIAAPGWTATEIAPIDAQLLPGVELIFCPTCLHAQPEIKDKCWNCKQPRITWLYPNELESPIGFMPKSAEEQVNDMFTA